MEDILLDILARIREGRPPDDRAIDALCRRRSGRADAGGRRFAKRMILPFYLSTKASDPERWLAWGVTDAEEAQLVGLLRMKPRRTASGVATVTVITKPWPCGGRCIYCPNDLRMPKSYLADEPACQRAERAFFDPYLQVTGRLRALTQMGHVTDKVELIVLGGSWTDYPRPYRLWFARELFRALNEFDAEAGIRMSAAERSRRAFYEKCGIASSPEEAAAFVAAEQRSVNAGEQTYNEAFERLYGESEAWKRVAASQVATQGEVEQQQRLNETAGCRCVGLSMETRPDAVTPEALTELRLLGCTKIQMGIQSLDARLLRRNARHATPEHVARALGLARLRGFKLHVHFMANLLGATPAQDAADYRRLVEDPAFLPDEVKIYPCSLVEGTPLCEPYRTGAWRPYTEDELVGLLVSDLAATPAFVRVSRMVRDISAGDILAGNKKANLRQLVEERAAAEAAAEGAAEGAALREIRSREINRDQPRPGELSLEDVAYRTAVSEERFLQWVTPAGRIAGFLRLSLPFPDASERLGAKPPFPPDEAMIREVHVYGAVAGLGEDGQNAQHRGLGRRLVDAACRIAQAEGYARVNVISAVGTREYYRGLGFLDDGPYQQRAL